MNKYETIMILDTKISEIERNNAINKIKECIESKGKIEDIQDIGKRKLAYEVKKNNEGYYYLIEFSTNPENITELERLYRITDEILKFIVVKKKNKERKKGMYYI